MPGDKHCDDRLLFSPGRIGSIAIPNRLVRSATWDPLVAISRCMNDETVEIYRRLASGGVGLIITGDFSVVSMDEDRGHAATNHVYDNVRIRGFDRLPTAVREANPECRIVAQVSGEWPGAAPSPIASPFGGPAPREMAASEIESLAEAYAVAIAGVQADGFDGAQLHAAHGGLLSRFLSPAWNRRGDEFGGSPEGRARVIAEIVTRTRRRVGDFPILIKMNGTDYLPGGTDLASFPEAARAVADAGVDGIEVSGGMWEALLRPPDEIPFPCVPTAESHARISDPAQESYFRAYAKAAEVDVPVILVGGNRHVGRLEAILGEGDVDFIALCRPFLREPDLAHRWREERGAPVAGCVSCNACLFDMYTRLDRGEPGRPRCICLEQTERLPEAREWLDTWVESYAPSPSKDQPVR